MWGCARHSVGRVCVCCAVCCVSLGSGVWGAEEGGLPWCGVALAALTLCLRLFCRSCPCSCLILRAVSLQREILGWQDLIYQIFIPLHASLSRLSSLGVSDSRTSSSRAGRGRRAERGRGTAGSRAGTGGEMRHARSAESIYDYPSVPSPVAVSGFVHCGGSREVRTPAVVVFARSSYFTVS